MRFCVPVSSLFVLSSLAVAAPLWVGTYNGPYDSYDEVHTIGTDDSGNVIVSGFSELSGSDAEFATIKYKSNGDTAWLRHCDPGSGLDGATALAVDRSGNIIVTGYRGGPTSECGDWVTVKYSATGESLWATMTDFGDEDRPSCIVVDSAGNSYVTGRAGSSNDYDMSAVKYDAAGNEVWLFNYNGGNTDMGNAVAVDGQGNTYLTGFTSVGSATDLMTWKLSVGGESLWATVYAGPAGGDERGLAIAPDGAGGAVVAGTSYDTIGLEDYLTVRYGPTGDTVWTRRYNGPGNQQDYLAGLVLDAAGNAYVTGLSYIDASHYNYATIKYSPDGAERWVERYAGPRNWDQAYAIALDADANVYVTGKSADSAGGWDVVTVSYDSAGNQRWIERFDMPSVFDEAYVLALSHQGNVYVGGRTDNDTTGIDYLTLAYASAGGIEEAPNAEVRTPDCGPTIVRGVLRLAPASSFKPQAPSLLDISGRKVLDLHPGPNDVSRLEPGVYFVSSGQGRCQKVSLVR